MDDQFLKLIFKIAFVFLLFWIPRMLQRRAARAADATDRNGTAVDPSPEESAHASVISAIEDEFGGRDVCYTALGLVAARDKLYRTSRTRGWWLTSALVAFVVLVPLPAIIETSTGSQMWTQLGFLGFLTLNIVVAARGLVQGSALNQPRLVVLLRRFRGSDSRHTVLARELGHVCGGMAVPLTVQDDSFPGIPPAPLSIAKNFLVPFGGLLIMFAVALLVGLAPRGGVPVIALWLTLTVLAILLFERGASTLIVRLGVTRTDATNFADRLRAEIVRIQRRTGWYVGTRVFTFPGTVWQAGIEQVLAAADAVVIDVTEVSDAVSWELQTTVRFVEPERVVIAWKVIKKVEQDIERHVRQALSGSASGEEERMPAAVRQRAARVVGDEWLDRCQIAPYEGLLKEGTEQPVTLMYPLMRAISIALAHRYRSERTPVSLT